MADKEKLKTQRNEAREAASDYRLALAHARDALLELNGELGELNEDWSLETSEYEADLNAERGRREIAEAKVAANADQQARFDTLVRERDQLKRQLHSSQTDLDCQIRLKRTADTNLAGARAGHVEESRKLLAASKERDDLRRQVQAARVAYEALQKALHPPKVNTAVTLKDVEAMRGGFAHGGAVTAGIGPVYGNPLRVGDKIVSGGPGGNVGVNLGPTLTATYSPRTAVSIVKGGSNPIMDALFGSMTPNAKTAQQSIADLFESLNARDRRR